MIHLILASIGIGGGSIGFASILYSLFYFSWHAEQKKRKPVVNWRQVGMMEIDIYGKILSPQCKPFFPDKEFAEKLYSPKRADGLTPFFASKTSVIIKPEPNTFYACKGHAHRYSDDQMVNPFTGEVLPDQWCTGEEQKEVNNDPRRLGTGNDIKT